MKSSGLILRSLLYHWRTNAAVVLGVATAVAVLTGALLVGDSVRGSLRDLVLQRLGKTDHVVVSAGFVREQLAEDIRILPEFSASFDGISPLLVTQGFVTRQEGNGSAGKVAVYGVDDRFWKFHGIAAGIGAGPGPEGRDARISPALARKIGIQEGATILVRVQRPSDVPIESLHGRKENLGHTLRVKVRNIIPREALGEFSLQPDQADVLAVFLPLSFLQKELEVTGRVNTILVSARPESPAASTETSSAAASTIARLVQMAATLDDKDLGLRILESRDALSVESPGGLLDNAKAKAVMEAATEMGLIPTMVFTYLANGLRSGGREVPYSLVSAIDIPDITIPATPLSGPPPIALNEWAARDLQASVGDFISMDYFIWEEPGRLLPRTMEFRLAAIVPIDSRDRDLAPIYPGITDSPNLENWEPPFPMNLRKVRPIDEEYWKNYRTTPKAFIPLAAGQELWQSRYGAATSIRIGGNRAKPVAEIFREYAKQLNGKLDPLAMGLAVRNVRSEALEASSGATDFGLYFIYFSFFLVVSALLLAALFFKLSVEQRIREVGLLRAVGFRAAAVRRLFMGEGLLLSFAGAVVGAFGGLFYGYLIVTALGGWWIGAVGTTTITLHVSIMSMIGGALAGIAATMVCIWATLRSLAHISERSLLSGQLGAGTLPGIGTRRKTRALRTAAIGLAVVGVALMASGSVKFIERTGAFFGAGAALLAACLCFFLFRFNLPALQARSTIDDRGWWPVFRLGLRNAMYRPARSVTSIATIAAAAFVLISVDAFRRDDNAVESSPRSGTGGYSLLVESLLPIVHDPSSREGKETLGISELDSIAIEPFRVRPGDDASCLNLYTPTNPRILAPQDSFIAAGRFAFQSSLASNEAERGNPWLLLQREEPDGAVPVIADSNSMTYVLHRKLGEEIVVTVGSRSIRLRLVAALRDSIFQGELLMSQAQFLKLFPEREGYQFLLVQTPPERSADTITAMEGALRDYGAVAKPTAERLAEFHRVENTYLSTFQMLGGLGLLLGTVGLGALMLRNALERRRELAMLRALGYRPVHFFAMAIAENALLLLSGLLTGALCAMMAIAPVMLDRGGRLPALSLLVLLCAVFVVGLIASLAATAAALRSPLLPALRSE